MGSRSVAIEEAALRVYRAEKALNAALDAEEAGKCIDEREAAIDGLVEVMEALGYE